jgi:hypothetical protein
VLLCVAVCTGCGHSRTQLPASVAVFALDGVGLPERNMARLRQAVTKEATRVGVPVVGAHRLDRVARSVPGCGQLTREAWLPCGVAVGQKVQASHVVLGAAGGLGSTHVLQLQLIGVKEEAVTRAVEETVFGKPDKLESIVPRVTARLFDIPRPRRWYERWWVWTIVGATVAAGSTAIVLAATSGDSIETHPLP